MGLLHNNPRYIIIGTGSAGIAAAIAIREYDRNGSIFLITEDPFGYYSRPGLAYLLTSEIPERYLYPMHEQDFNDIGVKHIFGRVTHLHCDDHKLTLADGQTLAYDRLLIAVGARALRPVLPGIDLDGVVTMDSLDDALNMLKLMKHSKTAVVIGGGITALEIVEGLVAKGIRTHYFLRGDHYWSSVLDQTESIIIEQRLKSEGVILHPQTELAEIIGKQGKVTAVRTTSGETIPCSLLGVAIGIQPRKELAANAHLDVDKGILVTQSLQTTHPDVFAAGDVAQVFDPVTGKSLLNSLWDPARKQGIIAGSVMAGQNVVYTRDTTLNVTRLAELTTTLIGSIGSGDPNHRDDDLISITHGDSEAWRERPEAIIAQANYEVNRLRLLVGKSALLGALIMGDQTLTRPIKKMIEEHSDITPIRQRLVEPGADLDQIIKQFIAQLELVYGIG